MMMPFGHGGSLFILINKFLFVYGTMVAYLLIIKGTFCDNLFFHQQLKRNVFVLRHNHVAFFHNAQQILFP